MIDIEQLKKFDRVHPYPAKYPIDLALKYVQNYTAPMDVVYDPFVGSGTTLLATSVLDRCGIGTDVNHIAVLISKFKILKLSESDFCDLQIFIDDFATHY